MLALAIPAFRETSDEDWLKKSELAVTFLDRFGNEVGSRGIRHNDAIPLEDYPDHLIKAVLATEDRRFYEHFGIDPSGLVRALTANARAGGVVQGGSSITQQLAKNLFLNNERTIERKVKEAFLAIWLETRLTKNEILKLYLDRAYMGGGAFGVDAAAQYYFNKSARDVNLAEAAMLAGLFKAPTRFAPHVNLPAARARANVGARQPGRGRLHDRGPGVRRAAQSRDRDRPARRARRQLLSRLGLRRDEEAGRDLPEVAERARVRRAHRPRRQPAARGRERGRVDAAPVRRGLSAPSRPAPWCSISTARCAPWSAGATTAQSQFNRATDALRQPGSSFKPYVYATALTNGFKPTSIVVDAPICLGNWCPQNYSHSFSGSMTLTQALTRSINTIPVRLSVALGNGNPKIGRAKIIQTAQRMGLRTPLPDSSSLPIGAAEVTVLDHTAAYATFPNLGKAVTPHAVLEVRSGNGDVVWRFDRDGKKPVQVMRPQVAHRHELHDEQGGRGRHRPARASSTASSRPARPAPPMPIATPGSSATPATMSAASGSATTTTRRPTA